MIGKGGHLLTATVEGAKNAQAKGVSAEAVDLSKSWFYARS